MKNLAFRLAVGFALFCLAVGCSSATTGRDSGPCQGPQDCQPGWMCRNGECVEGPNCSDVDGDGYCARIEGGDDCNDNRIDIHPTAEEKCDGIDNNCDRQVDEGCPCNAGDVQACGSNVGVCRMGKMTCENGQWGQCVGGVMPAASEICDDNLDNDCNGATDDNCSCSPDDTRVCGSNLGECTPGTQTCIESGGSWIWGPCQGGTQPVAEVCDDGLDNDCDGTVDNGCLCSADSRRCGLDVGICHSGTQACHNGVWQQCVGARWPEPEVCNGLDDDCDRQVDEGCDCLDGIFEECGSNIGECRMGLRTCIAGQWSDCQGGRQPRAELCDHRDNDCDGSTDEEFPTLGQACQAGTGVCLRTGIFLCNTEKTGVVCSAVPGTGHSELCDGLDNDCDGSTDEDFGNVGTFCERGVGECHTTGVMACSAAGSVVCNAPVVQPVTELCDGKDNNCDGRADEAFALLGQTCYAGLGECRRQGVYVCSADRQSTVCNATQGGTQTEVCDGRDNDCDGSTDESDPAIGTACGACGTASTPPCRGQCRPGIFVCLSGQLTCVGEVPAANETCDGLDNDCDGSTDETYPTLGQACEVGRGACRSVGYIICDTATGGVKCSAVAGTPTQERRSTKQCSDLVDNDCDGLTDGTDNCYPAGMPNTSCCTTTTCPICP